MSVEDRIRGLVAAEGGRVPVDRVVQEALGLAGATGPMARRLVEVAVREMRGLAVEGDVVVAREAAMPSARVVVLALPAAASVTLLPPLVAWMELGRPSGEPAVVNLNSSSWREGVKSLGLALAETTVLALSAGAARRVLRLASRVADLSPDEEPRVVALGRVARALGRPVSTAEEAAALVGAVVPEDPAAAAMLLARLAEMLAAEAGVPPGDLDAWLERDVATSFDFTARAFGRPELLAIPEAPGVYMFEDADGVVLYVGKGSNLRRRVASYFTPTVDERVGNIRDKVHDLAYERTGTELSALLREHQLIRELEPALNVQERVRFRGREPSPVVARLSAFAVLQPSADGGAEIVLLDRERGASVVEAMPEDDRGGGIVALQRCLLDLRGRRRVGQGAAPECELALTWLADQGASASVVDTEGDVDVVADVLMRLARDPDLRDGRVIPLR